MSTAVLYVEAQDEGGDLHFVPLSVADPARAAKLALYDEVAATLETLARLGNGDCYGNSVGNEIAIKMLLKLKAAEDFPRNVLDP